MSDIRQDKEVLAETREHYKNGTPVEFAREDSDEVLNVIDENNLDVESDATLINVEDGIFSNDEKWYSLAQKENYSDNVNKHHTKTGELQYIISKFL